MEVVGLNGFRGQWVAVVLEDGAFASARVVATVAEGARLFSSAAVIAVDIPIGLPDGYGRDADRAAQAFIGIRRNSVFLTLPRAVYEAPSHREANALARALAKKGISAQSYALGPKVLETEKTAAVDSRIIEVHPEVSFTAMAGEKALTHPKKTWTGQTQRKALLRSVGIEIPDAIGEAGRAATDDILDAAAAAWTANRKALGQAEALPCKPEPPDALLPGVIWY